METGTMRNEEYSHHFDGNGDANAMMEDLFTDKIIVGGICFIVSIVFGVLPFLISSSRTTNDKLSTSSSVSILSLSNYFGGGVFLGAALIHLLPEAAETLDNDNAILHSLFGQKSFPLSSLVCCIGFVAVMAIENSMTALAHPSANNNNNHCSDEDAVVHEGKGLLVDEEEGYGSQPSSSSSSGLLDASTVALVSALSFHSVFDGLAVGSVTTMPQLRAVSFAVLGHKPMASFALGSVLRSKRECNRNTYGGACDSCGWIIGDLSVVIYVSIFALSSWVGTMVGAITLAALKQAATTAAICQSLAAGTFLYAATMEALGKEHSHQHPSGSAKPAEVFASLIGILAMAFVKLLEPPE